MAYRLDCQSSRDDVPRRSCVTEGLVRRLRPIVHKPGPHDCFDTLASVGTICCLLPRPLQRSEAEGAFEQNISSIRRVNDSRFQPNDKACYERLCRILAQSLRFEAPYVWDHRRPRSRVKHRPPCRPVGHVHERRLDTASDGRVAAVLPV